MMALALASVVGCQGPEDPVSSEHVRDGNASGGYAWGQVELVTYDHAGGILPCVHVSPSILDEHDIDDWYVHVLASYEDPDTGVMVMEAFDVPLSSAALTEDERDLQIELETLQLEAVPAEETIVVTAELTTDPENLPDPWWAAVQDVELNQAWGILPCVHVARATYERASSHPVSMTLSASYEDTAGTAHTDRFEVSLPLTTVMVTNDALYGVEPPALPLAAAAVESTLVVQASLGWE